jgi:hypothetical protein
MNTMSGSGGGGNMMDQLKNNMMTMLMFKSMNGQGTAGSGTSSSGMEGMMYMVYAFIVTQLVDLFIKYLPVMVRFVRTKYFHKFEDPILQKIAHVAEDITDETHAVKAKTASIVINVGISDHDNLIGQALLDYVTNNKNTKHIKYLRQNFILNETEVINIADDLFLVMAETSDDAVKMDASASGGSASPPAITQKFEIFSFTKSAKQLREFFTKITHEYQITTQNKLGSKRFYFNMQGMNAPKLPGVKAGETNKDYSRLPPFFAFTMKEFQTNRKFSNLFGDEIDVIKKRVDFFVKNRKWYDEKGIPYTLGLLLSGAPGTGKTSCIKCLANETNRHIININLNNDITKKQLENLFFNESLVVLNPFTMQNEKYNIPLDQRIYVLEDIDCQGDVVLDRNRDKSGGQTYSDPEPMALSGPGFGSSSMLLGASQKPADAAAAANQNVDQMDMSFLLNLLDGVLETPGRIMIMTSNYPKRLDKALIRPGRIDIITEFTECTALTLRSMMEYMYGMALTADEVAEIENLRIRITPAEMSKLMFENLESKSAAMDALKVYGNMSVENIEMSAKEVDADETDETSDSVDEIVEMDGMID